MYTLLAVFDTGFKRITNIELIFPGSLDFSGQVPTSFIVIYLFQIKAKPRIMRIQYSLTVHNKMTVRFLFSGEF